MAKFGIIYTAFNTQDYVAPSLAPWIEARASKLDNHEFFIYGVCTPFKKFEFTGVDDTSKILSEYKDAGKIDDLFIGTEPMDETAARGKALKALMALDVDYVWQVDSDEFFTQDNIEKIVKFVTSSLVTWFKVSYKNYVFEPDLFITEPFTPARIHRISYGNAKAYEFWDDNNIAYRNEVTKATELDNSLPHVIIPKNIAWVRHMTWLNDERSKKKIEYQKARNWLCSFAWDDENGLVWNDSYFQSKGLPTPEIEADPPPRPVAVEVFSAEVPTKNP